MTPFERGRRDGQWTDEQIRQCGFISAEECLAHQEKVYQEEMAKLPTLHAKNPASAQQHAEYMEGMIISERESLRNRK